jgi:hypothetical protein
MQGAIIDKTSLNMLRQYSNCQILSATLIGWLLVGFLAPAAVSAALSQGYSSAEPLAYGTVVGGDKSRANSVKPSSPETVEDLLGVVVPPESALLSLSGGTGSEIQVATSGLASTLVSNLNGDIKSGDKVTVSPLVGVGMKALLSTKVLGVAQADFSAASDNVTTKEVKDKTGNTKSVAIGQIPVLVEVSYFVSGSGEQKTLVPRFVQDLANAVAGKKVSLLRIGLATGLLIFSLIVVGLLIFGSVHSSIISIGRNPLSQTAIFRSLATVILVSGIILGVTLGAIYLILSQ